MQENRIAKRAAIYLRVSTEQQEEEGSSLETQLEKCQAYCKKLAYHTSEELTYSESFTGMLYRERPELSRLRDDARNRLFDVLVVYALDRFSRVQAHQVILLEELEHLKIKFESVTEEIDDSLEGKIIRSIMGIVAEVEHEKILERTDRARRKRAADGNMLGMGVATYGYKWNEDRTGYLLNDDLLAEDANKIRWTEKTVVQRVFNTYAQGGTIRSIAMAYTNEQIPTRKGGNIWRPSTISQMLSNPIYTGKATAYKWEVIERSKGHMKQRQIPKDQQVALSVGTVPAIIDEQLFELVQIKLQQNKQNAVRNNKNARDTLLRCGLVVCGYCGANMHVTHMKESHRKPYSQTLYYCPNGRDTFHKRCQWTSITGGILDGEVWSRATPLLEDFALVAQRLEKVRGKDPSEKELPPIVSSLEDVNRRQKNFLTMLNGKRTLDADTIDMIQEQLEKLGKEKERLELERQAVLNMRVKWEEIERQLDRFYAWCMKMAGCLHEASMEEKREALELLNVKARVWRDGHDPRYVIDFAPVSIVSATSELPIRTRVSECCQ